MMSLRLVLFMMKISVNCMSFLMSSVWLALSQIPSSILVTSNATEIRD